jgi:RHS repeat-associated protein
MGGGVGGLLYSKRWVPEDGAVAAQWKLSYDLENSRGDVTTQTDSAGATWQANYEAFGMRTAEAGTNSDPQRANTKDEDASGLLNEGFRYRDLEAGVFISRDPAGFVDGPNVYTYVQQNPWTRWDPEGLGWRDWASAALDCIPIVSTIKTAVEFVAGEDLITGEKIDRATSALSLGASLIPGGKGALKIAKTGCQLIEKAMEVEAKAAAVIAVASDVVEGKMDADTLKKAMSLKGGKSGAALNQATAEVAGLNSKPQCPDPDKDGCFLAGTLVSTPQEDVAIEDIQPGDRVTTFTEEEQAGVSGNTETEVDPPTWRMLEVEFPQLPQPDGKMLVSRTLKPLSWIEEHGVREGLWILMGAEHGERGKPGRVKNIGPCPEVKSGPGRVVLSTFQVASERVLALRFSGWGQEILTTTVHPFWSESRQAWVAAGRLQLGETVRSRDGHGCRLESIVPVAGQHTVYNLEVEGDHVYRVGTGGLLVHNACPTEANPRDIKFSQPTVSQNFSDGRTINGTVDDLNSGKTKVGDIPAIRVVEHEGALVTLDNRRLAAFQTADIASIPVQRVSLSDPEIAKEFDRKNKPINGGNNVVVTENAKGRKPAEAVLRKHGKIK